MKYKLFTLALVVSILLAPTDVGAARLWSSGCEFQSDSPGTMTNLLEWVKVGTAANTQVSATVFRSGLAGCRAITTSDWGNFYQEFSSINETGDLYFRFYFRIATMSSHNVDIFGVNAITFGDEEGSLVLNSTGTLSWHDDDSTNLGTSAGTLSADTWYRIEVNYDALDGVEVRVDGTQVISVGAHDGDGVGTMALGICIEDGSAFCNGAGDTTAEYFFDDVAINDTSGGSQTSWPGTGSIAHMQPDGAGDNSGCTAGSWASVDEITPDDATTICTLTTDGGGDLLDVTEELSSGAGIDSFDTVTLVQVGIRDAAASAASASWNLRVKSASGGTTSNGTATTHDDVTYQTNGDVAPRNYTLTSYTDPTTGVAWTPTGTNSLDNMQIGANSVDAAPDINLTTLWALVEYVDGAAAAGDKMRARLQNARIKVQGGRFKLQSN